MMIGFAGLSHLGIVSSIAATSKGFDVIAYDPDEALCGALADGRLPFVEPGLPELLAARESHIRFTHVAAELSACELIIFSKDVPTDEADLSDLLPLHELADAVVVHAPAEATLVLLSQVPPGFTDALAHTLTRRAPQEGEFRLFYQVETLIVGDSVQRALRPERLIVGCSHPADSLPGPYADYLGAFDCPIIQMGYESAELTKLSINAYLVSSITVANTMSELCEAVGADWAEIVPALKSDERIGPNAYLTPGLGIAGGNLERDLATIRAMASEMGTDANVVRAWSEHSRYRRDWALRTMHSEVLGVCATPIIAVWGIAYKPDTSSTKNSPALDLIEALGPFPIRAYDPCAVLETQGSPNLLQTQSALEACRGADALVIMTAWREFSAVDLEELSNLMTGRVIIDPLRVLSSAPCLDWGFSHFTLGRQPALPERSA